MQYMCIRIYVYINKGPSHNPLAAEQLRLLPVLCCSWLPSDPGNLRSATTVLLGIRYDSILSEHHF